MSAIDLQNFHLNKSFPAAGRVKYTAVIAIEQLLQGTVPPELNVCTLYQLQQNVPSVPAAGLSSAGAAAPCGSESHSPQARGRVPKNTWGSLPA